MCNNHQLRSLTHQIFHLQYVASVGVGSHPTQYNLIVDTGSANTFVGATKAFTPSSTSSNTLSTFSVFIEGGKVSGDLYDDQITLASGLVIQKQLIGVAKTAQGFEGVVDGVLGLGPAGLSQGTSSTGGTIPTITDNLFSQGVIAQNLFALSFALSTQASEANGEITFGGTDETRYTGSISYVPITTTSPSSEYWGIDASISYGTGSTPILPVSAGIIDSGTSLILLATNAYNAYKQATGAIEDASTGVLTITPAQFSSLQPLHFTIGSVTYELTANAQIFPRQFNSHIGGAVDKIYLIIGNLNSQPGSGLDFTLGKAFLERFYVVFDTGNRRIGKSILRGTFTFDYRT